MATLRMDPSTRSVNTSKPTPTGSAACCFRLWGWDPRAGAVELAIPRLGQGSYLPDWLLEPRRRAERVMGQVVAQADVTGVALAGREAGAAPGDRGDQPLSGLRDGQGAGPEGGGLLVRPLEAGPSPSVGIDALRQRGREGAGW
jgi:putative transposase